ncbi:MAG: type 1 glutamine amidotransferase domain-containing protein [bacterium]
MSRIAVIITDMFEDMEYARPAEAFREMGHQVIHAGLEKGAIVKGKSKGTPVKIDLAVSEASASDFDALFIPGGYSPDRLRINDDAVRFVRDFVASGKPVLSICHAPQLLITAQVLKGRKITGWKSIMQDIKNAGAEFIDQAVVEDGNIISSRRPDDIPAFIDASLKKLGGRA